ncbi:hypothetical protein D9611_009320 [Ephemerocybe angulata]|uniref:tRNA ligase n=1 Tax=Ephemerocybe angulata TaxID=980116 RepID=A0A8H5F4H4_9AGAR|nr:hypothetical protein D9611_009320 [Tulosesus angulatus]
MTYAIPQTPTQALADSHLIDSLIALSRKSPKLVRSTEAAVPGCESISVRSWKMNEFKYYDIPLPFPTLARGLFTTELDEARRESEGDEDVRHRIVVRGYDKFFNIGEVPWTTWEALEKHTCAPYVLSLKSNGCIIFIAAVTPEKLVVTSKHSLGNADEVLGPKGNGKAPVSHAGVGRRWLGRYLEAKGRTEADLAQVLWDNRWTAVAELCDDSFEEHVLPYPPSKTGLHLHGLNVSSGPFETLSHTAVDAFAEDWGFIRTATITLSSIGKVREFTSKIAETGKWNGEAVEGFVVRTHVSSPPTETKKNKTISRDQSPYHPGSDFFFKIKFDEPYMMYRDWREVTKTLLSVRDKQGASKMGLSVLPKSKTRRKETEEYVKWVVGDIKRHPELYEDFGKGKGIIAARERFFAWKDGGGEALVVEEKTVESKGTEKDRKTVIAPIAVPGCGKTAVSLALAHLFGWGHTQSDNVQGKKKSAVTFLKNVEKELETHDVVIADKNNHLKQHRAQLRDTILASPYDPVPRLIALDWSASISSQPPAKVHRIASERIWARGGGHQTLRPDTAVEDSAVADGGAAKGKVAGKRGRSGHEEVVWMFLNTMEELGSSEVDGTVDMDIVEDEILEGASGEELELKGVRRQLEKAIDGLAPILHLYTPSEAKILEALQYARKYEEDLAAKNAAAPAGTSQKEGKGSKAKMEEGSGGTLSKKARRKADEGAVRYFGILPEVDLPTVIEGAIGDLVDGDVKGRLEAFWQYLRKDDAKVTKRPHITLVHRNEVRGAVHDTDADGSVPADTEGESTNLKDLWEKCAEVHEMEGAPLFEVALRAIVWDGRVLAIVVDDIGLLGSASEQEASKDEDDLVQPLNNLAISEHTGPSKAALRSAQALLGVLGNKRKQRLHVTVGTRDGTVKPIEAGWLVEAWRAAGCPEGEWAKESTGGDVGEGEKGGVAWAVKLDGEKKERVKGVVKGLVG